MTDGPIQGRHWSWRQSRVAAGARPKQAARPNEAGL